MPSTVTSVATAPRRLLRRGSGPPETGDGADRPQGMRSGEAPPRERKLPVVAVGLLAGVLVAASLPPWGWWPLAFAGLVLLDRLLAGQPARSRFLRGWLVGAALLGPTMAFIKDLSLPGYVTAVALYGAVVGLATVLVPPHRGRWLALPAAWVVAEAIRGAWPFGGVPMSILAMGQVSSPLAGVVRLGGTLLLGAVTVAVAVAVSAAIGRRWLPAGIAAAAVVAVVGWAAVAPHGYDTGRSAEVALVQGGGPQGTRAINTNPQDVTDRHLAASAMVPGGMDLVVWPEDVIDTPGNVADSVTGGQLAALAQRLDAPVVAGVVETEDADSFHNAAVVWNADGAIVDRYEKVHRVPFGEVVPFRGLLEGIAGDALPQRDAIRGLGPNTVVTPAGKMGVVISWEVFFGHRAREAIASGGEVLLNPTNGSSYTGTFVQTQQIASSRLRAIETGRWVVQVAPTGFSAFVTPDGEVLHRTGVSEQAARTQEVTLRRGLTPYVRWGEWPTLAATVLALAGAWLLARRPPSRREGDVPPVS